MTNFLDLLSSTEELEVAELQPWTAADLRCTSAEDLARGVIIWQWCRGTPEADGDLLRLSDDKWCPCVRRCRTPSLLCEA